MLLRFQLEIACPLSHDPLPAGLVRFVISSEMCAVPFSFAVGMIWCRFWSSLQVSYSTRLEFLVCLVKEIWTLSRDEYDYISCAIHYG